MMKLILVCSLFIFGCSHPDQIYKDVDPSRELNPRCVVMVEGCEYFKIYADYSNTYVHKGNCKNSIHRCDCK